MTRMRLAAMRAVFGYLQFALSIVTGFVLVPMLLRQLGARQYGLWLASGDLLGYAAVADLGVLGVLPWMLAEADGRKDRDAIRTLMANGLLVGTIVAVGYVVAIGLLWSAFPSMLRLTPNDRVMLAAPLVIVVAATMITYPFRVFQAVLSGIQDVVFAGWLATLSSIIGAVLTIALVAKGHGLYALAWGAAVPALFGAIASALRIAFVAPDLLRELPRPRWADVRHLLTNGLGVWLAIFGWQLLAASNNIVIASLGHPEWVPIFSCTAKLSAICLQMAWVLPDSGLIGLAQLHGEHESSERVRRVVTAMLQLHLLLSGAAAVGVLAFNPSFVTRWVGPGLFGGLTLNALLALAVVSSSLVHGIVAAASVLGNRVRVGVLTLGNGIAQLIGALALGSWFGLAGIASAGIVAALAIAVPTGVALLRPATGLTLRRLVAELIAPWSMRIMPLALAAAAVGWLSQSGAVWLAAPVAAAAAAAHLWQMRDFFERFPLSPRWTRWLVSLRLVPGIEPL